MEDKVVYESVCNNYIEVVCDETDYEVLINGMPILSTGEWIEAQMIAESLDVALSVLHGQNRLKI